MKVWWHSRIYHSLYKLYLKGALALSATPWIHLIKPLLAAMPIQPFLCKLSALGEGIVACPPAIRMKLRQRPVRVEPVVNLVMHMLCNSVVHRPYIWPQVAQPFHHESQVIDFHVQHVCSTCIMQLRWKQGCIYTTRILSSFSKLAQHLLYNLSGSIKELQPQSRLIHHSLCDARVPYGQGEPWL